MAFTREQQDEYAVSSHQTAVQALEGMPLKSQIVPVELPARKKGEAPRCLRRMKAARRQRGGAGQSETVFKKDAQLPPATLPQ